MHLKEKCLINLKPKVFFSGCAVESCVLRLQAGRFQIVSVTRLKWKVSLIFFLDCTDNDDLRADFPWMGSTKTPENILVRRWDCLIFMDWSLVTWKMRQDLLFIYNFFWFLQRCSECSRRWFMSFVVDDEDLKLFIVKVKVAFFSFDCFSSQAERVVSVRMSQHWNVYIHMFLWKVVHEQGSYWYWWGQSLQKMSYTDVVSPGTSGNVRSNPATDAKTFEKIVWKIVFRA